MRWAMRFIRGSARAVHTITSENTISLLMCGVLLLPKPCNSQLDFSRYTPHDLTHPYTGFDHSSAQSPPPGAAGGSGMETAME